MLDVLTNRIYRHLFLAQVIALVGTGLATVALGLLAYDLAGANAGSVLGTALRRSRNTWTKASARALTAIDTPSPSMTFIQSGQIITKITVRMLPMIASCGSFAQNSGQHLKKHPDR
ncbi:hypothetical protein CTP10_R80130 (plasmid) [Cupriavidus sp. P-10]|nr:hypothetical protein CTP10_R80130 [Cupriavidus sp. P-10]